MKGIPGIVTDDGKYVENQVIPCYMTDSRRRLRPVSFMDIAQEIAFRAANVMHFGYDDLLADGKAWILSRMHFRFVETPSWRDEVEVASWNRGQIGPFFIRDFYLKGECANVLATSSWLVLDLAGRFACRHVPALEDIPEKYRCDDASLPDLAPKVVMPRDVEPELAGTRKVVYADVDFNEHTNNARYVMWVEELLSFDSAKAVTLRDLYINFNHETKPGDTVAIYKAAKDGSVWFEGKVGDVTAFTLRIDYTSDAI